jgi:hypothetical protein
MTKLAMIGAACVAVVLATASPALAAGHGRGGHGGFHGGGFHGGGFGVGPGIAAGVIAGAALGAYGPGYAYSPGNYDDSYAYDNGYNGAYDNGYAARNGFVCQPGTLFRGEDGRRHLCQ